MSDLGIDFIIQADKLRKRNAPELFFDTLLNANKIFMRLSITGSYRDVNDTDFGAADKANGATPAIAKRVHQIVDLTNLPGDDVAGATLLVDRSEIVDQPIYVGMYEAGFVILRDGTRTRTVNPRRDLVDDAVAALVRYLVGHARLSTTVSWTLLWSSRSASILSAQNCINSTRSGSRSSRS
jgi:hypothetical protein